MTREPIIAVEGEGIAATGVAFALHEWAHGPNPGPPLHVHHHDDEAWHVLEGTLRIRFSDRSIDVTPGGTAFVPAGVSHTFGNPGPGEARHLIVMSGRILQLIEEQHLMDHPTPEELAALYRKYDAEVVE